MPVTKSNHSETYHAMNSRIQWKGRLWSALLCKGGSATTGCAIVWSLERFRVQYRQIVETPVQEYGAVLRYDPGLHTR